LNCVIVDANAENRQEMSNFLSDHGATVIAVLANLEPLPPLLRRTDGGAPHLVMVNLDPNAPETLRTVGPLVRQFPGTSFFVMSQQQQVDVQLLMDAMHFGIKEFIRLPADPEKLVAGIERVAQSVESEQGSKRAKVIHVIPSIGGCGATSIACNVAASLAKASKTALLDLDLVRGGAATSFDLNPRYTIADVMSSAETLDKHLIDNALAVHHGTGLCVLARPESAEDSQRVNKAGFNRLLSVLSKQFDYVVLDSVMSVDPMYASAIGAADVNLLVIQLNVPSVRNAERFLATMRRMGVDAQKIIVVVNRFEKKATDILPEDAAKALNMELSWLIPNDFRSAIAAINYGEPLVLRAPKSEVSASYGKLVQMLNGRTSH
jgi:pilus assembly protein CpaE